MKRSKRLGIGMLGIALVIAIVVIWLTPAKIGDLNRIAQSFLGINNVNAQGAATETPTSLDWKPVEQAMGKSGALQPGGVFRISLPRTDLRVMVQDVQLKPAFALGSHVEFLPMGSEVMVMGDLVLT